jgi:hypothetical protein
MTRIFISYRRDDAAGVTGRVFDRLDAAFPGQVFMDVENGIRPGADFVAALENEVARCGVMLAIIGGQWLDLKAANGKRRIDQTDDFVRVEIASALKQGKTVVPVIVDGAQMPAERLLPSPLKQLSRCHAVSIRSDRFNADIDGLIGQLRNLLGVAAPQPVAPNAGATAEQRALAEESEAWRRLKDTKKSDEMRWFLKAFPGGIYQNQARAQLEQLCWNELGERPTKAQVNQFVAEWPGHAHGPEVKTYLWKLGRVDFDRFIRMLFLIVLSVPMGALLAFFKTEFLSVVDESRTGAIILLAVYVPLALWFVMRRPRLSKKK